MKRAGVAIAFLLVVCLAVSLVACGGGGGEEEPTSAMDKSAFHSNQALVFEVYVMYADGSGIAKLTIICG